MKPRRNKADAGTTEAAAGTAGGAGDAPETGTVAARQNPAPLAQVGQRQQQMPVWSGTTIREQLDAKHAQLRDLAALQQSIFAECGVLTKQLAA